MGVTIHYEGRLRDEAAFETAVIRVQNFCARHGWEYSRFEVASTTLQRVMNEQDVDYVGPSKGVEVMPHPGAEPLAFEFDRSLYVQEFCKTQFAGPAVHRHVISLLEELAPLFESLTVEDEGEYWETHDEALLVSHLNRVDAMLADFLAKNPDAYGPIRLPSGRIVDIHRD